MATVAFESGIMRRLVRIGFGSARLGITYAKVCRPPGELIIVDMFVTLKTVVVVIARPHEWLLVVILQKRERIANLIFQAVVMAIDTADIMRSMKTHQ